MLVFNREKCIADIELHGAGYEPDLDDNWINQCDGRIVDETTWQIGVFRISPDWCNEINVKFNLTPAEVEYIMQDDCTIDDINNSTPENIIDFLTPMYRRGSSKHVEMIKRVGNYKWYNIEIPYNTREYINRADRFKEWLADSGIKFEPSAAGNMVHFEIYLDKDGVKDVNSALDRIIFYDAIKEI